MLDERCGTDPELRRLVDDLLVEDAAAAADPCEAGSVRPAPAAPGGGRGGRIGRYRLVRLVGEGGMGVVYEAEQESPRRTVAVKLIRPGFGTPDVLRRFEHESEVLGRLQHPGIAQIHEAGREDSDGGDGGAGAPYFVMELIRGQPLLKYAAARGLAIRERVELVAKIADAVQHAHQKGVIHRDLKPSNVLVDDAGQPKILDFGIARVLGDEGAAAGRGATVYTSAGQLVGTVPYMSPEQAAGDPGAIDVRTDVYALGVMLFELLTGRLPYDVSTATLQEALRVVRETEPVRPGTLNRRLRGDLETITLRALEKEPARRYQSAADLASDLRRHLRDEPILVRPATTLYQWRKFARRHRALVGAAGAIAVSLVLATAVSTVFAINEARQRARAERRFGDVRALANSFLFTVHDEIEQLPGATRARRTLVETGLKYLDSLAQEAGSDPGLLAELAEAYGRIGDILGNPRRQNLGDPEGARAAYEKCIALRKDVIDLDPGPEPRVKLATAYRSLGTLEIEAGRTAHGIADLDRARAALRAVLDADPDNVPAKRDLASAISVSGAARTRMGRLKEALEDYLECLRIDRELVEASGDEEERDRARREVSADHNEAGAMLVKLDRLDEADAHFQSAIAIRKDLAERHPLNVRHQRDLAISYHRTGSVHAKRDDPGRALADYRAALDILRKIAQDDPADARAQRDYTVALEKVGDALLRAGRPDEALDTFRACVDARREHAAKLPGVEMATNLAVALERVGDCLVVLGRPDEAVERFAESYELAAQAVGSDPRHALAGTVAIMTARKTAELLAAQGRPDESLRKACDWYRRSLAVLEGMAALDVRPLHDSIDAGLLTDALNETLARVGS